jgi:hypothetical protein
MLIEKDSFSNWRFKNAQGDFFDDTEIDLIINFTTVPRVKFA